MAAGHTGRHRHYVRGQGTLQEKSISQAPQSRWTPGWQCLSKLNDGSGGKRENGSQWTGEGKKNIPLVFRRSLTLRQKGGIHMIRGELDEALCYSTKSEFTNQACFIKMKHC